MVVSFKKWGGGPKNKLMTTQLLIINTLGSIHSHTQFDWRKWHCCLQHISYGFHLYVCYGTQGNFMNSWWRHWYLFNKHDWFPFHRLTWNQGVSWHKMIFFWRVHIMTTADLLRLSNMQFTVLGQWTKQWLYTVMQKRKRWEEVTIPSQEVVVRIDSPKWNFRDIKKNKIKKSCKIHKNIIILFIFLTILSGNCKSH